MTTSKTFHVVVPQSPAEERGFMPSLHGQAVRVVEVAQETLKTNLLSLIQDLSEVFNKIPPSAPDGFAVESIDVSISISSTGGIELVGKVSAGVSGGMTISFRRSKS